jgi:hypothetical protein
LLTIRSPPRALFITFFLSVRRDIVPTFEAEYKSFDAEDNAGGAMIGLGTASGGKSPWDRCVGFDNDEKTNDLRLESG